MALFAFLCGIPVSLSMCKRLPDDRVALFVSKCGIPVSLSMCIVYLIAHIYDICPEPNRSIVLERANWQVTCSFSTHCSEVPTSVQAVPSVVSTQLFYLLHFPVVSDNV